MYDKDGTHVWNPKNIYRIIQGYFKCNLYEESIESLLPFAGQQIELNNSSGTERNRIITIGWEKLEDKGSSCSQCKPGKPNPYSENADPSNFLGHAEKNNHPTETCAGKVQRLPIWIPKCIQIKS